MSQDWMDGAERVVGAQRGGSMAGGPPKVSHHITTGGGFDFLKGYLVQMGFEPTLMADPATGRIAQFLSAGRSAYAMQHPAGHPDTNRQGDRHIQIEWCWKSMDDLTMHQAPRWQQTWDRVLAFCRANGVPDAVPFGSLHSTSRDARTWQQGGHAGHRNAPGNDHADSLPVPDGLSLFHPTSGETVSPQEIEAVAQRVFALLAPVVATHQDMKTLLRGDAEHPASITSIAKKLGVEGVA